MSDTRKRWQVAQNVFNLRHKPWTGAIPIEEIDDDLIVPAVVAYTTRGGDNEGNARLIAQSPRLLSACKAALEFVTDERWGTINYMETDKVYADAAVLADLLRDVIKAAEG